MRTYRASIAKMKLDGTVESVEAVVVKEGSMGTKTKTLEKNAWSYRYSDLSFNFTQLDLEKFRDYDHYLDAYFMWVERSDDQVAWETEFFGYIAPDAIDTVLPERTTNVSCLSVEKLFETSPDIISRGAYRAAIETKVQSGITQPGGYIGVTIIESQEEGRPYNFFDAKTTVKVTMESDASLDRFRRAGSLFQLGASRAEGGNIQINTPVLNTISVTPTTNPEISTYDQEIAFYTTGNTSYPIGGTFNKPYPYRSEVVGGIPFDPNNYNAGDNNLLKYLFVRDDQLARNVKAQYGTGGLFSFIGAGFADAYVSQDPNQYPYGDFKQYRFMIKEAKYGRFKNQNNEDFLGIRFEFYDFSPNNSAERVNVLVTPVVFGDWVFNIMMPDQPDTGSICTLIGDEMYGKGTNSTDPFNGKQILEGLAGLVPFFNKLNPVVQWDGQSTKIGKLDRTTILSNRPEQALTEFQKLLDVLISFNFGPVQANGLPQIVIKVTPRALLAVGGKTTIPLPVSWQEKPTGKLPTVVVKGPGPSNIYNPASESVGWYAENAEGDDISTPYATQIPSGKAHVELTLEKLNLRTFSFFDGEVQDYYYNDWKLKERAKSVYQLYGRFYRSVTARLFDPKQILPDLVGKIITEPFQDKDAIVMEQKTNYSTGEVTLELLMDTTNKI